MKTFCKIYFDVLFVRSCFCMILKKGIMLMFINKEVSFVG